MNTGKILVVDDEPDIRNLIREILEDENFNVAVAEHATEAKHLRETFSPDLVLLDIWMPDTDGIALLKQWRDAGQLEMPVVMISGHGTVETAVEATRLGAYDFIEKPVSLAKLLLTVNHALENAALQKENSRLKELQAQYVDVPIGPSKIMQGLRKQITRIAGHNTPVLITGESGVGKELLARYLHKQSARADKAFVSVGLSALSSDNFLTEFFGQNAEGKDTAGFFQQAEGGTLFLKDIADMALPLQAKLQSTLENKCFNRVGDPSPQVFDTRVIASTHHQLMECVDEGRFREDFYYQLSVLPIHIPPLRERAEDIPDLLKFYVEYFVEKQGLPHRHFTAAAQNQLHRYSWPGNVRELKNLVQRLLILGTSEKIDVEALNLAPVTSPPETQQFIPDFDRPLKQAREQFEKDYLRHRLNLSGGNISKVAEAIGMDRTNLYRKLKALGILIK